ncbi:MAG: acyltransferase family protein, partial [Xanthobacteraceae bacterium]
GQTYTNPAHWFGWSVALEMWFYLVFAAVLMFGRDKLIRTYVSVMLSIVALVFFYHGSWLTPHFLGTPLALEFVAGVLLYQWRYKLGFRLSVMMILVGVCLMWYAGSARPWLAIHDESIRSGQVALLRVSTWGFSSFLVVAGCIGLDVTTKVRWPASLVWMGDISYSFYLAQPFAILTARVVHFHSWWATWLLLFSVTTLLAALANRFIEVPATRALRAGSPGRKMIKQDSSRQSPPAAL